MASRKDQKEQARAQRAALEADVATQAARARRLKLIGFVSAAAITVVVIAIVISLGGNSGGDASNISGTAAVTKSLDGIDQSALTLGDAKAPVRIIEFGDLQCPACKTFADSELQTVIDELVRPGKATLKFDNYVIIGPQSTAAAKASLAAAAQGRYWQFVELFYRNQGTENSGYVTSAFLEAVAKAAGVSDLAKWNKDRESARYDAELSKVEQEAGRLGFSSTPSFQVEGPKGKTAVPDDNSASAIEAAVSKVQ